MRKTNQHGKKLTPMQLGKLFDTLKEPFQSNMSRHKAVKWTDVAARLEANPEKLWSLSEMERTGGEPDVIGHDKKSGEFIFFDCSPESPKGRRSLCYDPQALESRKENKPKHSAIGMATEMGITILTEAE